ncbi:MAG: hypothetical protein Q7R94_02205 [bacterium]|nr:hypothetical protein [bacterium]
MALRTTEVLDLDVAVREDIGVAITDGPNDWDMWLCLRGTIPMVSFYVDQPIQNLALCGNAAFLAAGILSLRRQQPRHDDGDAPSDLIWEVTGSFGKSESGKSVRVYGFTARYNSTRRKGQVLRFR